MFESGSEIVKEIVENFKVAYPGDTILAVASYEYQGIFQLLYEDVNQHRYIVKLPQSDSAIL